MEILDIYLQKPAETLAPARKRKVVVKKDKPQKPHKHFKEKKKVVVIQFARRNKALRLHGYQSYQDFLNSDMWRKIKLLAKKKADSGHIFWQHCNICLSRDSLQLHHIKYGGIGRSVSLSHIYPLCPQCHKRTHEISWQNPTLSIKQAMRRVKKEMEQK